jgi:fluoride exporter
MTAVLVTVGALVGAPLRLAVTRAAVRAGREPAIGTLVVNVVGSALLGLLAGSAGASAEVLALVGTGFCGTLTTFSTFGADLHRLAEGRRLVAALGYAVGTLVLGLGAAGSTWALAGAAG